MTIPTLGRTLLITTLALVAVAAIAPPAVRAQSCILTRLDSPVLSAFEPVLGSEQKWQVSIAWRYGKSDRHFVGTVEQTRRTREGSQVINTVHLADLGLRYNFSSQTSLSVGVPYLMAERSSPIRDANRDVVGRSVGHATGPGDLTVIGNRLLWDPAQHPRSNVSLGLGIKIPTGRDSLTDTRVRLVDGEYVASVETIDESVQPGDGGFGLIVTASGYQAFLASGALAAYGSATYIVAPEGTNGVYTYRSAPGEDIVSISDQYVVRAGLQLGPASWKGFSAGLGGRIEGIPVHDLIGPSDGFRRPGYMLSVEPSLIWNKGPNTVTFSLPVAVQRDRQKSVPDIARGAHGDAAFPDFIVLAGYYYRF